MPSILDQYRHVYNHVWDVNSLTWVNQTFDDPLIARTASAPTTASVGVSSAQAVASNTNRKGLELVNLSANDIALGFAATAVVGSGVVLQPGASWFMRQENYTTGAVNAIAGGASSTLAIQEYT